MTDVDIAQLLEDRGRPDLADAYRTGQLAARPEPTTPPPPVEDEGEAFTRELREALGRNSVSLPGLLDQ